MRRTHSRAAALKRALRSLRQQDQDEDGAEDELALEDVDALEAAIRLALEPCVTGEGLAWGAAQLEARWQEVEAALAP